MSIWDDETIYFIDLKIKSVIKKITNPSNDKYIIHLLYHKGLIFIRDYSSVSIIGNSTSALLITNIPLRANIGDKIYIEESN